jgi:hypothetical protein
MFGYSSWIDVCLLLGRPSTYAQLEFELAKKCPTSFQRVGNMLLDRKVILSTALIPRTFVGKTKSIEDEQRIGPKPTT